MNDPIRRDGPMAEVPMADAALRAAAAERLLTAELVAVLAPSATRRGAGAGFAKWSPRWAAAAVAMFGLMVVLGVAALRASEGTFAQQPVFDPLAPGYEHILRGETVVDSLEELARIPAEAQYLVVQKASDALLEAVARHRPLRSLGIPGNRPFPLDVLAHAPELTSLLLGHSFEAEELRKLRHAPKLQHLYLTGQAEFDEARGMAVAELRFLRTLLVVGGELTPAGIAALTNLSDLECLLVGVSREQGRNDWLHELPKLRRLVALVFVAGSHPPDFATTLALMPNLRLLELRHCDDQVLAALPQKLERLVVSSLGAVSESTIRSLAKRENLRGLGFRAGLSNRHDDVCELVRALPLERFDARVGALSPELWDELQRKPRLRHLSLDGKGGSTAEILAAAARCQSLETLEISLLALPKAREFVPLAELRQLRRIDIEIDPSPRQFHAPSPELTELRALFAGRVEIRVD